MPEIDQRVGTDSRDAEGRTGIVAGLRLGRTAVTAWALTLVLGLAGFGTALGATPPPGATIAQIADATTNGGAAEVDPLTILPGGTGFGTVTAPSIPVDGLKTVTAPSFPTATIAPVAPSGTAASTPTAGGAAGVTVPAGPAAELRQAAFTTAAPDVRASVAIRTALAQLGLPYVWGGDGPANGDAGFDCSGLTTFSYGTAGVLLPRTAATQYNAGPHVPTGAPLQPGDLVFYGTTARVHHVGMYLGDGRMVNAPTFGKPVQVAYYRYHGDDYLGATRPAAAAGSLTGGWLPEAVPVPLPDITALTPAQQAQQAQQLIFPAPIASLPAVLPQPGDPAPSEQQSAAQAIAESDAVTQGRTVGPQLVTTGSSQQVAGMASSSSASITTSPVATSTGPASSSSGEGVVTSPSSSTSTSGTESPAGSAGSASTTTSSPAAPAETVSGSTTATTTILPTTDPSTPTSSVTAGSSTAGSTPVAASGSTTATSTLLPTSLTPTPKPVATKTSKTTVAKAKASTSSASAVAKSVATTEKPVATKENEDSTSTKAKASSVKTSEEKSSDSKDSETKDSSSDSTKDSSSDSTGSDSKDSSSDSKDSSDSSSS
jgi:cell wall-associated NlpC family hydrolase